MSGDFYQATRTIGLSEGWPKPPEPPIANSSMQMHYYNGENKKEPAVNYLEEWISHENN